MIRKKSLSFEAAKLKMADLCARAEHCESEIREKLRKNGISLQETDDIVDFLIKNRFIDNARFASSFTNDKVRFSGWGRNKVRQALALKRIPAAFIREALENIDEDLYLETLHKVALSKSRHLSLNDYDDRIKLYRYLLTRGFESSLISTEISTLRKAENDESDY